jgi:hypothetical protein
MLPEGLVVSVLFSILLLFFCKITKHYFLVTSLIATAIAVVTILGPAYHAVDIPTKIALGLTHVVLVAWPIALNYAFSIIRKLK